MAMQRQLPRDMKFSTARCLSALANDVICVYYWSLNRYVTKFQVGGQGLM